MAEAGKAPDASSEESTSQHATEHLMEPCDEASSLLKLLNSPQSSLPDSVFHEDFLPWDILIEPVAANRPPILAEVSPDISDICYYCRRYGDQNSENCPGCGSAQYSTLFNRQTLQSQSQAQIQEPLSISEEDSTWLNFLTPEFDLLGNYLPNAMQDHDIPEMPRVEFQVLDELVFDVHMNPIPNPRRRRRRLSDGERELIARKRGKVCVSCRRKHMKFEHVVVGGSGQGAGRFWVCPAHKPLPFLKICPDVGLGYNRYQSYNERSKLDHILIINGNRKRYNAPKNLCWSQVESPKPKPWPVPGFKANRERLAQSAREARSFVSYGRGAPWTLLFRDLFTRGQTYHS